MDLNQLKYFMATVKHMNLTRAARELFITRQALSQAIHTLEEDLDTPLFSRENNRLTLTPSGVLLAKRAPEILDLANEVEFQVRRQSQQFDDITLAYSQSLTTFLFPFLPEIIQNFGSAHRNFPLQSISSENDEIWTLLKEDRARFGLMTLMPWNTPEYTFVPLWDMTLGVSLSADHPLAEKEEISLADLSSSQVIGMGDPKTSYHDLAGEMAFHHLPFTPEIIVDPMEAYYFVKKKQALLLDYADYPDVHFPGMKILPIRSTTCKNCRICLIYRTDKRLSAAELIFIQYVQRYLKTHPLGPKGNDFHSGPRS